jgi:hypothetical protein
MIGARAARAGVLRLDRVDELARELKNVCPCAHGGFALGR